MMVTFKTKKVHKKNRTVSHLKMTTGWALRDFPFWHHKGVDFRHSLILHPTSRWTVELKERLLYVTHLIKLLIIVNIVLSAGSSFQPPENYNVRFRTIFPKKARRMLEVSMFAWLGKESESPVGMWSSLPASAGSTRQDKHIVRTCGDLAVHHISYDIIKYIHQCAVHFFLTERKKNKPIIHWDDETSVCFLILPRKILRRLLLSPTRAWIHSRET